MRTYVSKTPDYVSKLFPKMLWNKDREENTCYLTFDDGPTPGVTDVVLDLLKAHNTKATFFCIGKNIEQHPVLFERIRTEGHTIGNHTHNHLNGWRTKTTTYIENTELAEEQISNNPKKLFRPPYGKIRSGQAKGLLEKGYSIVMWDVLSGDFDLSLNKKDCLTNVLVNTHNGSIVVFHDSEKAKDKLLWVLPQVLEDLKKRGISCAAL